MLAQQSEIANRQLLHESDRIFIYRGDRSSDGRSVILKTLKTDYVNDEGLAWFRREYEVTRNLDIAGAIAAYEFWDDLHNPTIVLEDFGGKSLTQLGIAGKLSIGEFLKLAVAIADCLSQIHRANIIHKDINPNNILFNRETQQVKIIDFGISTRRSRERAAFCNLNTLEGTPAYIAPEQTGRMNREIDCRSDLYSLGVTFFLLLSGRLPFLQKEMAQLIHAHIAHPPPNLNLLLSTSCDPLFVAPLVDIVMKLMAKAAEERYQSAYGLKADLEFCWQQWQEKQKIEPFELGSKDRDDRLQIPQKLYGRKHELSTLLAAFEEVIRTRQPALCLVKGYSGIGKSALVAEIHKPITARNGFFISGKFDQLQRNSPYSAIAQALSELMQYLFVESSEELQQWRERLKEAVGNNGRILSELVPKLEILLGKQPEVPQLGAKESQNRFNFILQNFIRVFTQSDRPLVLFIDDLQWADSASLELLHLLMTSPDMGNLFIVSAYRDNEVSSVHPLILKVDKIRSNGTPLSEINLTPLPLSEIKQFVADTLCCSRSLVRSLAELLQVKTDGNPFFLKEFLKELYLEELLNFDWHKQEWLWDIKRICERDITANVVDLLAGQLKKLPLDTQRLVRFAACIGNKFDLSLLGAISKVSLVDCAGILQSAIAEGFLVPLDERYKLVEADIPSDRSPRLKFAHDRIQQAAYKLILDNDKIQIHLRLGRLLLQEIPPEEREERIFEIANHLNLVRSHIRERAEKDELVQLNLIAGKKAKASAARRSALNYLQTGLELLIPTSWEEQYKLTLELHREAVESAYLCGEFELREQWSKVVLQQARSVLDKVSIYESQLLSHMANSQPEKAVDVALTVLNLLGVKLPQKPNQSQVMFALGQIKLALFNKQPQDLLALPKMKDPEKLAALKILASVFPAAYIATPQLSLLIALKQVSLSLKYGNAPLSAYAYCNYGLILCGVLGSIETGYQFGQLGEQLLTQFNAKELKAKVTMIFNTFVIHWRKHLQTTLEPLLKACQSGIDTGDIEFSAYSLISYTWHLFFTDRSLNQSLEEIRDYCKKSEQLNQKPVFYKIKQVQQIILNLTGNVENPIFLNGEAYNETIMLDLHEKEGDRSAIGYLYIYKLLLCYLFESYSEAANNIERAERNLDAIVGSYCSVIFYFYSSLTFITLYPNAVKSEQKRLLKKIIASQKKMKQWAHHAPMNHLHKYHLIEAERYRILGKPENATKLYDLAIQGAKENQYLQEESLANELAGKFYLASQRETIAQQYLQQAYRCYDRWGAKAKTQHLMQTYPQVFRSGVALMEIK